MAMPVSLFAVVERAEVMSKQETTLAVSKMVGPIYNSNSGWMVSGPYSSGSQRKSEATLYSVLLMVVYLPLST